MPRSLLAALSFAAIAAVTLSQSAAAISQGNNPPTQTPPPKTTPTPKVTPAPKTTPAPKATPAPKTTPAPKATPAPKQTPPPDQTPPPKATPAQKSTPPPATSSTPQQVKPRPSDPQRQGGSGQQTGQQAKPRPPAPSRPPAPPPRVVPQHYFGPRAYYFPPVSLDRGFYYHPYFGFYFGPYYGPFYPYPGPFVGPANYSTSALRLKVKPAEARVYVNGYYAGEVDDFDGIFQRLYLPAGEHTVEFVLNGYRTFGQGLYLNAGEQREVVHQMERLRPGERNTPPLAPRTMRDTTAITSAIPGGQPASPFGMLTLQVDPADAQIVIDDEVWLITEDQIELVIHVPAGPHRVEVRKEGYQTFRTGVELSEGSRTRLSVTLIR